VVKLTLGSDRHADRFIGRRVGELDLPEGCRLPVIRREGDLLAATEDTPLREGDRLYIIGEPDDLKDLDEDEKDDASEA